MGCDESAPERNISIPYTMHVCIHSRAYVCTQIHCIIVHHTLYYVHIVCMMEDESALGGRQQSAGEGCEVRVSLYHRVCNMVLPKYESHADRAYTSLLSVHFNVCTHYVT